MTLHGLSISVPAYKCQTIKSTKNYNNIIHMYNKDFGNTGRIINSIKHEI